MKKVSAKWWNSLTEAQKEYVKANIETPINEIKAFFKGVEKAFPNSNTEFTSTFGVVKHTTGGSDFYWKRHDAQCSKFNPCF